MKIGLLIVDIFLNKFKELREIELFYDGVKKIWVYIRGDYRSVYNGK